MPNVAPSSGAQWSQDQLRNATIIAQVGRSLGASARDIQIAIMTALVESGLHNVNYGDRDSLGLFQQRAAWGSRGQRLDPSEAARMFFTGGHAGQRGLFDIANRTQISMGEAAQAVQVSAFPGRYAEQQGAAASVLRSIGGPGAPVVEPSGSSGDTTETHSTLGVIPGIDTLVASMKGLDASAPTIAQVNPVGELTADSVGLGARSFDGSNGAQAPSALDALSFDSSTAAAMLPTADPLGDLKLGQTSTTTNSSTGGVGTPVSGWRAAVVAAARRMLGTPYVWGGTSVNGVDCSGLISLIYNARGFNLPRISADQARSGRRISFKDLRPGDLVAIDNSSRNNGADHIAIYVGNGMVIQAPHPGGVVELTPLNEGFSGGWGVALNR